MASERRGEGLGSAQESGDTGAHLAKGVEDAVQDDEEREDGLDGPDSAAQDEAQETPEEEAEGHGLLAANPVHEEAADDAAWEVEAVDHRAIADVLHQGVVGVQLGDDG